MDPWNWTDSKEKKKKVESAHPKQMSYGYLWRDWVEMNTKDSFSKMKEHKLDLKQKLKSTLM